ncbi:MAG TPA: hypothetical protein VNP92_33590 [Actinophytocola sp.]|nr:hypothetical protein [Actinophytocola sp.]
MRTSPLLTIAALPLLVGGLAACGDDSGAEGEDHPRADGPTTLAVADPEAPVPAGYQRQECELVTSDRSLTVVLDLPVGAKPPEGDDLEPGNSCWYPQQSNWPKPDTVPEFHVLLLHEDDEDNEEDDVATLEDLEAGFEDRVGEESVDDVVFDRGVVVFGETVGDRLTWTSEYEGEPEWNFRAEADGVQLWLTAQGEEFDGDEMEQVFQQISASLSVG